MAIEVRPCAPDELGRGISPIFHFFGRTPSQETIDQFAPLLPTDCVQVAVDDGAVVGGAGAFPFQLTVPGGRVGAGGVTLVGVLPTHRRRGVLTKLMRAQLDDLHERGEAVAYLWASEATIYRRFGYGMASLSGEIDLPRDRAAFASPVEATGRARLVDTDEALALFPDVYERVARETPGMFGRTTEWWRLRALADPEWRRGGGGEMQRVVLDVDGRPEAYALYRLHQSFEHFTSIGHVNVIEAMGSSPSATAEVWRLLLDIDWMQRVQARLLPVDHPLFFLLAEPRRMKFMLADALWVRLVDVRAALAARSYRPGEPVVLEVEDGFCPWNAGRVRVGAEGVEQTHEDPDLRLDVAALGSLYLGGFTFAQLARAARLEELREGAVARADALFATDRAPWCPEIF